MKESYIAELLDILYLTSILNYIIIKIYQAVMPLPTKKEKIFQKSY